MASGNASSPGERELWASRIGVILAVAGSAVGLGNFLRFPGQAAQNGGGAFMIPYFISLLLLGFPIGWAEWTMGRYGGVRGFNSAPGIYSLIWPHRLAKYFGTIALLVPLVIYMYYVFVEAWCLGYAWNYLNGSLMMGNDKQAYIDHFDTYIGNKADGFFYEGQNNSLIWVVIGVVVINFYCIYRGVSKGIEDFCKVAMPIMAVCAIAVLIRVLTLDSEKLLAGLGSMWNPNFEYIAKPKTWMAAAGQIFFTLGVGFGIIVNYSSYLRKSDDVALSGLTASSVNEFFEVCLGGLITLPAAFIFLGTAAYAQGTFDLGFKTLPNVFAVMPGGRIFGALWFFMLFLAAITSSLSMLQPVIAFLEEGLGLKRHASAALLGLISTLGLGFVMYFSKGMTAMNSFDYWVGTVALFVLALVQTLMYGWVFGIDRGHKELHEGANIRVPYFVQLILKYVTPVYLGAIFIGVCVTDMPTNFKQLAQGGVPLMSVMFLGVVFLFLLLLTNIAGKRWEREGRIKYRD